MVVQTLMDVSLAQLGMFQHRLNHQLPAMCYIYYAFTMLCKSATGCIIVLQIGFARLILLDTGCLCT